MSNVTYTREDLESKPVKELKNMCVYDLKIPGMTKKAKGLVIAAILEKYGAVTEVEEDIEIEDIEDENIEVACNDDGIEDDAIESVPRVKSTMQAVSFNLNSIMTKPNAPFGNKTTTTIHVSCGASSGDFPVVGRNIYEVSEFLREVLNVTRMSIGLVNGQEVDHDYIINENDNLEFLKPAGQKG